MQTITSKQFYCLRKQKLRFEFHDEELFLLALERKALKGEYYGLKLL